MSCYMKLMFSFLCLIFRFFCESIPQPDIPDHLFTEFTLDGTIPVVYSFRDDSYSSDQPLIYSKEQIDHLIEKAKSKETFYYGPTDKYLYDALEAHSDQIVDKEVAVMGSVIPWYESILLCNGSKPITIEYNKISNLDPRLKMMSVEDYEQNPCLFDAVLSISSYEHDGLGRYGDAINPNGDLIAMDKTKKMLKKDGLLFLSVPIGQDALVWNLHRIYGNIRLELLLRGWQIVGTYGFTPDDFNRTDMHQPIFVLKPI